MERIEVINEAAEALYCECAHVTVRKVQGVLSCIVRRGNLYIHLAYNEFLEAMARAGYLRVSNLKEIVQ